MAEAKKPQVAPEDQEPSSEKAAQMRQQVEEFRKKRAAEKAPTTKTEMRKLFKKGGFVRAADGIAQRGKTKGRMI